MRWSLLVAMGVVVASVDAGAQSVQRLLPCQYDGSCARDLPSVRVAVTDTGIVRVDPPLPGGGERHARSDSPDSSFIRLRVHRFKTSERVRIVLHGMNPFLQDSYALAVVTRPSEGNDDAITVLQRRLPALFSERPVTEGARAVGAEPPLASRRVCNVVEEMRAVAADAARLFSRELMDPANATAPEALQASLSALQSSEDRGTELADAAEEVVTRYARFTVLRIRAPQLARADSALARIRALPLPSTIDASCQNADAYRESYDEVVASAAAERRAIDGLNRTPALAPSIAAVRRILVTPSAWSVQQVLGNYDAGTVATVSVIRTPASASSWRLIAGTESNDVTDVPRTATDTVGTVEVVFVSDNPVSLAIGGVASMLGTSEYSVIAAPDSGRRIGVTRDERWRTPIVGVIHVRLPFLAGVGKPIHLSGGAALNSTGANISDRDWLLGLSVAFARQRLFVSWGAVLGQSVRIDDAWKGALTRGDRIPSTITSIPTTRERRFSQFFGVSLRSPKLSK